MKTILFAVLTSLVIAGTVAMASTSNPTPTPPPKSPDPTERTVCYRHAQTGITRYVECETCCVEIRSSNGTWIRLLCSAPNCPSTGLPPVVN